MRLIRTGRERVLLAILLVFVAVGVVCAPRLIHEYRLHQARQALRAYDLKSALTLLETAAEQRPSCPRTQFLLARTHRRGGNLEQVAPHLKRAWDLGFPVETVRREELLVRAQLGQMGEAEAKLREHLGRSGEDIQEICEALVNGYLRNYRFDDAARWLDAWQADFGHEAQPHFFRGRLWQHLMMWNEAADEFSQALKLAPQRDDIRNALSHVLMELHEYDQASALFQQRLEQDPLDRDALVGKARCLMAKGETDQPRAMFEKVLAATPTDFDAQLAMGQLAISEGKATEALKWLEPALAGRPHHIVLRYELAQALQAAGRGDEAKQHYSFVDEANEALSRVRKLMQEVQLKPELVEPRFEIGKRLLEFASAAEGLAWLYSVLEFDPDHRATHTLLADHYQAREQWKLEDHHRRLATSP